MRANQPPANQPPADEPRDANREDGVKGQIALVTGAAGGIGEAICAALGRRGATVAALDRDRERLDRLASDLAAAGCEAVGHAVNLTDRDAVAAAVDDVERRLGPIGILVNAAGVMRSAPVLDLTGDDWAAVLAVNATAVFTVSQLVARRMVARRRGAVVTVASNAATVPRAGMAAYCASKAASAMLTRCLGLELAGHGVRCNIVSPGSTDTPMLRSLWTGESGPRATLAGDLAAHRLGIPLGRIATPEDIAGAVTFLCSDEARHITMHDLCVDGGATLGAS